MERILRRLTRLPGVRSLWTRFPVGSVDTRVRYGIWSRPHYAYGVYSAAQLAKKLALPGISVIEFGVAGGRGLLALEEIARAVSSDTGVEVATFGFDAASGMPEPADYRDLPHVWAKGFYRMDEAKLRQKLSGAELVIGDVGETIPSWLQTPDRLPLGFIAFDLDYYSSTMKAFRILECPAALRLPRVYCYFDDIIWPERACHNEFIGELRAIGDFNRAHETAKLCPIHMLRYMRPEIAAWHEQMYVMHDFDHPLYCRNITPEGEEYTQHPL